MHRACREITKPLAHENMPIQACTLAHWAHPTRHGLFHTRATIPCLFASFHSKLHIQSTMLLQRSSQHSTMQSFGTFLRKHIKDKSTWIGYPKSLLAYVEYAWQVYISAVESLSHGPRLVLCFAVVCATLVQRNLSKHSVQRNLSFGTTARTKRQVSSHAVH